MKLYYSKKLTKDQIKKKLEKAKKKFKEIALRPPDKILVAKTKLPRIVTPKGKEIDLQKKYAKAKIICAMLGVVPYLPYIAKKGNSAVVKYIHFLEQPLLLVVDPDDETKMFLSFGENVRVTDRGIEG